jgi:hypothetical protein
MTSVSENSLIFAHARERERGFFETDEREQAPPVSGNERKILAHFTRKISTKMDKI